ncbi:MAG: hypothetical protein ACI8YQ_001056 [Polaribacter sp.]|jgi:hypothetical protein
MEKEGRIQVMCRFIGEESKLKSKIKNRDAGNMLEGLDLGYHFHFHFHFDLKRFQRIFASIGYPGTDLFSSWGFLS